nr:hypothetical protein CFP56_50678 [Quercus suber]
MNLLSKKEKCLTDELGVRVKECCGNIADLVTHIVMQAPCPNFSKNYQVVMSYPYLCLCFLVLRLEQYAHMFDLLGQVGNLEDAKRTIE